MIFNEPSFCFMKTEEEMEKTFKCCDKCEKEIDPAKFHLVIDEGVCFCDGDEINFETSDFCSFTCFINYCENSQKKS